MYDVELIQIKNETICKLKFYTVTTLITDQQGTEWQPQLHTTTPLGRT